jgi:succinate dehydrogenase hydrophobic anchor subunit
MRLSGVLLLLVSLAFIIFFIIYENMDPVSNTVSKPWWALVPGIILGVSGIALVLPTKKHNNQ